MITAARPSTAGSAARSPGSRSPTPCSRTTRRRPTSTTRRPTRGARTSRRGAASPSPVEFFAIIESALRHERGLDVERHRDELARALRALQRGRGREPARLAARAGRRRHDPRSVAEERHARVPVHQAAREPVEREPGGRDPRVLGARARAQLGLDARAGSSRSRPRSRSTSCALAQQRELAQRIPAPSSPASAPSRSPASTRDDARRRRSSTAAFRPRSSRSRATCSCRRVCPWTVTGAMAFAGGPFNNVEPRRRRADGGGAARARRTARRVGLVSNLSGIFGKQAWPCFSNQPNPRRLSLRGRHRRGRGRELRRCPSRRLRRAGDDRRLHGRLRRRRAVARDRDLRHARRRAHGGAERGPGAARCDDARRVLRPEGHRLRRGGAIRDGLSAACGRASSSRSRCPPGRARARCGGHARYDLPWPATDPARALLAGVRDADGLLCLLTERVDAALLAARAAAPRRRELRRRLRQRRSRRRARRAASSSPTRPTCSPRRRPTSRSR